MTGKPIFFDPDIFCSVVEMLISSDEVERAFLMLRNGAPAYYRDHPTPRMLEIRESLHRQMFTPAQYAGADSDGVSLEPKDLEQYCPPRAQVLISAIRDLNRTGIKPNIMEIGPGTFWLPYSLRYQNLDFTYEYQSLTVRDLPFEKPPQDGGVNLFVAFELIEHLTNEDELYQAYLKFKKRAKMIFISTPLYTYGGGIANWRDNALGHLRTYTPRELGQVASQLFEGYKWTAYLSDTITLVGDQV